MKLNVSKIKLAMATKGLTQKLLSELTQISRQSISNILSRGTCSPSSLLKIANALEVEPQTLIDING